MNETLLTLLGGISVFANRISEAVKATLHSKYPDMNPDTVSAIALMTSIVSGIVGALVLNVNILALLPASPYTQNIPPLAGVLLAGCIASFGSEGLHWLLDLLAAGRNRIEAPATTTTVVAGSVEEVNTPLVTTPPAPPAPDRL